MKITKAEYLTSITSIKNMIDSGVEFAFVGRRNVGKNSFINSLISKKLARTSSTPGRTRMINYFLINDSFRFVDLPGYGYHSAGKKNEKMWATLIEDYLNNSKTLRRVFLLVDIRHKPSLLDKQMLAYLTYSAKPFTIVATKADKVAKSKINNYLKIIAQEFLITPSSIIPYSTELGMGKDMILDIIEKSM